MECNTTARAGRTGARRLSVPSKRVDGVQPGGAEGEEHGERDLSVPSKRVDGVQREQIRDAADVGQRFQYPLSGSMECNDDDKIHAPRRPSTFSTL